MYIFDETEVFNKIKEHWTNFMKSTNSTKCVIGISGGIDSTCTAALACKIFGKENVIGISLPCDEQADIVDVMAVFDYLQIKKFDFNIGNAFHSIIDGVENNALEVTDVTRTNLPARLRMATLYAFAQSIPGALVINTCNISESCMGYDTLFGDNCGSYAPIQKLTKTEVRKLASYIGVPEFLVMKTPIDGLQKYSDEERFGFSYETLDNYIRKGPNYCDIVTMTAILGRFNTSKYKLDMVHIKGPEFDFPNYLIDEYEID
jgi:NAD+ synthase